MHIKLFSYTAESLLEKVTYANGTTQSLTYDLAGNVTAETDALRHVTKYTYDKNGNLLTETDALGNKVQYSYTPEGWLESITKADGTVLTFEYDKTGSLLTQNVGDGQSIQSSYNEIGMVTEVSSAEGTITYQYNEQGYLVSVTNVNGDKVSYTYDEYGNKTSMTYPDGRTVSYTYDSMNRMTSVTRLDGDITRYAYDAAGRRIETSSSSLTTAYSYDSVGNLLEQATSGASEIAFSYSYNKNGYITGEVRTENGETTTNDYTYDALGELTSFLQSTGYGEQYTYDKAGNMTEKVITPAHADGEEAQTVTLKMSYNKGNQLTAMANGKDKITYKYDKNGSMVEKALSSKTYGKLTDSYAYNALDQLTSYTGYDGYRQEFTYDANGMRLSKSETGDANRSTLEELLRGNIAGLPEVVEPTQSQTNKDETDITAELEWATTEYLYDLTQEYYMVIQETNSNNSTTAYAYGLERIASYSADSKVEYVYDGRRSVAQTVTVPVAGESVTSTLLEIGLRVQSFSYTAFGEQMGAVKVSGFAYNAEAYDAATGMLNLRARQYEPAMNRFSQKDIVRGNILMALSINCYAYVQNTPVNYGDPSGETLIDIAKKTTNAVSKAISNITSTVKKTASNVVNAVKKATTSSVTNAVKKATTSVTNAVKKATTSVTNAVKKATASVTNAVNKITTSAITAINTANNIVKKASSKAGNSTKTTPQPTNIPRSSPGLSPQITPSPAAYFVSAADLLHIINRGTIGNQFFGVPKNSLSDLQKAKKDYEPRELILKIPRLFPNDYDYPITRITYFSYNSQSYFYPSPVAVAAESIVDFVSVNSGTIVQMIEYIAAASGIIISGDIIDFGLTVATEFISGNIVTERSHSYKEGIITLSVEAGFQKDKSLVYSFTDCEIYNCSVHTKDVQVLGYPLE